MQLLDTSPEAARSKQIKLLQMDAQRLVDHARAIGMVITITLQPRAPLAMGSYDTLIELREARHA